MTAATTDAELDELHWLGVQGCRIHLSASNAPEVLPTLPGVAERIRRRVATLHGTHDSPIAAPVSVSIGLAAMCDARDSTPADLLHAADLAMYEAKHMGRNQVRRRALACCTASDAPAPEPA